MDFYIQKLYDSLLMTTGQFLCQETHCFLSGHDSPSVASDKVHLKKAEQNRAQGFHQSGFMTCHLQIIFQGEDVVAGPDCLFFIYFFLFTLQDWSQSEKKRILDAPVPHKLPDLNVIGTSHTSFQINGI